MNAKRDSVAGVMLARALTLILLSVLGVLAPLGLGAAWAEDATAPTGILFEIRVPGDGQSSFLFGTIHSEDPRVTALPEPARAAFDASSRVVLEVVPDASAIVKAMLTMAYTNGRRLRDVLPANLYRETLTALAELGMTEAAIEDLKPWAVVTLLANPTSKTGEFLDMLIHREALAAGKMIQGLETMAEQLAVFDALSEADQIALLRETLESRAELPGLFEALVTAYVARDLAALQAISDAHLAAADPVLAEHFRTVIIAARNRRMLERMTPLIEAGGSFIAVGALHLTGEAGLLESLRKRGFEVTIAY